MMASSNGNISALLDLCAGNSPVTVELPSQRPVTRRFDVFFDLRLNKRLCKQSWGWWFETPSRALWRHRDETNISSCVYYCLCSFPSAMVPAHTINTLRPRQNGRLFADDIFKCIFLNENIRISIKISPKFVPKGPINNIPALVQIMAWRRSGGKPLSEPMVVSLLTHICVTRPQWVNSTCVFANTSLEPLCHVQEVWRRDRINDDAPPS